MILMIQRVLKFLGEGLGRPHPDVQFVISKGELIGKGGDGHSARPDWILEQVKLGIVDRGFELRIIDEEGR